MGVRAQLCDVRIKAMNYTVEQSRSACGSLEDTVIVRNMKIFQVVVRLIMDSCPIALSISFTFFGEGIILKSTVQRSTKSVCIDKVMQSDVLRALSSSCSRQNESKKLRSKSALDITRSGLREARKCV